MTKMLDVRSIFKGKHIFFIGGTGFLGKVTLSMLLARFPEIGKVYLMVRAGSSGDSEERFWNNVFTSPAFEPLREMYDDGAKDYLGQKLIIVGGDITHDNLGYSEDEARRIAKDIDIVLNSSGNVSFNPPLETALKTNVTGTRNLLAFVKRMKEPKFIHTSTCFVAGNRSGQIWEDDPLLGYFPRREDLEGVQFSVEQEVKDSERLTKSVVEESTDATLNAEFRAIARKRLKEEGRDPDDESTLNLASARERKDWIRNKMSQLGLDRAQWWGWPNIYTYTKSMGEQLIAVENGIRRSIVRPAIVESAISYPFAGWNEGFNTTAPLILFGLNGQHEFPVNKNLVLDIIPVDFVASAVLAITAQTLVEEPKLVHQLCSGDSNPNKMRRIVTLLGLYKRKHFKDKESGNKFINAIAARMEARPVSEKYFDALVPRLHRTMEKLTDKLEKSKPYGTLHNLKEALRKGAQRLEAFTREGLDAYEQFKPFMLYNEYQFRADNVRTLFGRLSPESHQILTWAPESIDWYHYWLKVHFPGLQKWVFPKMEEIGKPKPKRVYTYRSIPEMLYAITKSKHDKIAMRMERSGQLEEYTYGDMRELALRAAAYLQTQGVQPDECVGLVAENSPEWGLSYFGIILAGATCIPIDKELTADEITNLLRAGAACGVIISPKQLRKHATLLAKLKDISPSVKVWITEDVFRMVEEPVAKEIVAKLPKPKPTGTASLIFTSGTTGHPKGVMLTHKNLTSMMSQLLKVYDVSDQDGFLSILPLHHTFEFSTGFMLPFSKGAQITYLDELNSDTISDALKNSHVTIMVGVPALWDLLRRRILNRFGEKSEKLEDFVKMLISINKWVREKTSLNFGPFLFFPVHHGLGGKIRYLISGGSALTEKVFETFYGLGFSLNEGYGLTEASPVLTVTRPSAKPLAGSVGQSLPGVEIRIHEPNEQGIGQIIARGPNVMAGYYKNRDATDACIIDGWLYTGDLGYLDDSGNLFLVGRSKDLILGASGKNIYPDELEETYSKNDLIKELSIVGLPDETGERVACLVVPDYERDPTLSRGEVRHRIEEHFRSVSAALPIWKRVRTLEFQDTELPRTGTRKVKRREVIMTLQGISTSKSGPAELFESRSVDWLAEIVASVSGKSPSSIHGDTTFDELGFDSLMYTELGTAIEATGTKLPSLNGLSAVTNINELAEFLRISGNAPLLRIDHHEVHPIHQEKKKEKPTTREVPKIVQNLGSSALDVAGKLFYSRWMKADVSGKANIPSHTNFIVAPNHASHLDIGLVKIALGDAGKNLAAVAAADYFFDTDIKRTFFENFTNVIPMERKGSMHESFKLATQALHQGFNLLIFPEGTRSTTGNIAPFKVSLGYLALRSKRGILPLYLGGTFEAMPKGDFYPKPRKISAAIGPFLPYEELEKAVAGLPKNEAYRLITGLVQTLVEQMRDGMQPVVKWDAIRKQWRRDQQLRLEEPAPTVDT